MENLPVASLRVVYVRVSGQEQVIKGLSLEAQEEDLREYCRKQGWIVVDVYVDAAKTARKRIGKRTNFLRMLEDVKQDKVDLILFTRLDRWFRSVADYYKVMEILEAHNCGWKTTQEQYDTSTANGRLLIYTDEQKILPISSGLICRKSLESICVVSNGRKMIKEGYFALYLCVLQIHVA